VRLSKSRRLGLLEAALELEKAGEAFVLATVVRVEKPTSAKPGARALITAGGEWLGWIGGSCSRPAIASAARKALQSGEPSVVKLDSTETCASGGSLEIYVEPHLPKANLVVVGHLPVAEALVELARALGFRVTVMTPEGTEEQFPGADRFVPKVDFAGLPGNECYVVVASHGNYDEEAIRAALETTDSPYVALVSSRKRAESMLSSLALAPEARGRLKFPAGLDIGAVTPEEIALSILAEVVQARRARKKEVAKEPETAKDPVCGMSVEIATARHVLEKSGVTYYFCGAGCKDRFAHDH
jgi:xanthine dehydrogenase accessory factor